MPVQATKCLSEHSSSFFGCCVFAPATPRILPTAPDPRANVRRLPHNLPIGWRGYQKPPGFDRSPANRPLAQFVWRPLPPNLPFGPKSTIGRHAECTKCRFRGHLSFWAFGPSRKTTPPTMPHCRRPTKPRALLSLIGIRGRAPSKHIRLNVSKRSSRYSTVGAMMLGDCRSGPAMTNE